MPCPYAKLHIYVHVELTLAHRHAMRYSLIFPLRDIVMTQDEKTSNEQSFMADLNKFALKHNLTPIEAMVLPELFRRGAVMTEEELWSFTYKAFKITEVGQYLAQQARELGATDAVKEIYDEFLQKEAG
tara:strand:- start:2593 stop:2979 length:387 start_codon:yes stop_codon:yes gene_type:complete